MCRGGKGPDTCMADGGVSPSSFGLISYGGLRGTGTRYEFDYSPNIFCTSGMKTNSVFAAVEIFSDEKKIWVEAKCSKCSQTNGEYTFDTVNWTVWEDPALERCVSSVGEKSKQFCLLPPRLTALNKQLDRCVSDSGLVIRSCACPRYFRA